MIANLICKKSDGTLFNLSGPENNYDALIAQAQSMSISFYDPKKLAPPAWAQPTTAKADLLNRLNGAQTQSLARTYSLNVGSGVVLTTMLDAKGRLSMMEINAWAHNANDADTMPYANVDFSSLNITKSQAINLALATTKTINKSYAIFNEAAAKIASGAISDASAIDAIVWPPVTITD